MDGDPVPAAMLTFNPQGDQVDDAPSSNGFVKDGKFTIDQQVGPIEGNHEVFIEVIKPSGVEPVNADDGEDIDTDHPVDEIIGTFKLTATVSPDGENTFQFDIEKTNLEREERIDFFD